MLKKKILINSIVIFTKIKNYHTKFDPVQRWCWKFIYFFFVNLLLVRMNTNLYALYDIRLVGILSNKFLNYYGTCLSIIYHKLMKELTTV